MSENTPSQDKPKRAYDPYNGRLPARDGDEPAGIWSWRSTRRSLLGAAALVAAGFLTKTLVIDPGIAVQEEETQRKKGYPADEIGIGRIEIDFVKLNNLLHNAPRFIPDHFDLGTIPIDDLAEIAGTDVRNHSATLTFINTKYAADPEDASGKLTPWYVIPVVKKDGTRGNTYVPQFMAERQGAVKRDSNTTFHAITHQDEANVYVASRVEPIPRSQIGIASAPK